MAFDCQEIKGLLTYLLTTQNSSDNLHSYLQTNIIAQLLSVGGEGAKCKEEKCEKVCSEMENVNVSHCDQVLLTVCFLCIDICCT